MAHMVLHFLFDGNPRRFIQAFIGFVVFFFVCTVALAVALDSRGLLPPPPLSYTNCIDKKLEFLHELDAGRLKNADIMAIGSSTTWRNLDFSAWLEIQPDARPVNIAPCYLHIDQIAYFAGVMLKHMPKVETVVTIIHPRDFEECRPDYRQFVHERDVEAYIFRKRPAFTEYLTHFRPGLVRDLIRQFTWPEYNALMSMDGFGSGPLTERPPNPYYPEFVLDQRCKSFMGRLEAAASEHGARLVVVFFPILESWAAEVDPGLSKHRAWRDWVTDELDRDSTLVINTDALKLPEKAFADPVHLFGHYTPVLTRHIAVALAEAGENRKTESQ